MNDDWGKGCPDLTGSRSKSAWLSWVGLALLAACSSEPSTPQAPADMSTNDASALDMGAREMSSPIDQGQLQPEMSLDQGKDGGADQAMPPEYSKTACNGFDELCARRLDEVMLPGTHNAFATYKDRYLGPNHLNSMQQQLDDGVRALMLDVHDDKGVASLCHAQCGLGSRPLVEGLQQITDFMIAHPREVFVIHFEDYVGPQAIAQAIIDSGLDELAYTHALGQPWPTLAEMIEADERVVIWTQGRDGGEEHPWLHHAWDVVWDNNYAAKTPEDMDCAPDRGGSGDLSKKLFFLNHFLTNPVASRQLAEQVNHDPFLSQRIERCRQEAGRIPNVIVVDFYSIGDLFEAVRKANGLPED